MAQDTDEDRIRIKAHEIWESEGHPHGRDEDHWVQAKEIIAIQDGLNDTLLPRDTGLEEPVEPTQAVEPYGDVPNLTDQGEHDLTAVDREPEVTKPSRAVYTTGENMGHVARPKRSREPGADDRETVTPAPKVASVTPTPSNPTLGSPAPRAAKAPAAPKTTAVPKTASATPKPLSTPSSPSQDAPAAGTASVTGKSAAKAAAAPASVTKTSGKSQPKR